MGKGSAFSAKRITGLAVLLALVIVLQLIGGYLKIGATSLSFVLVPIVLGGLLFGAWSGAFLGFAFGFITLLFGITGADYFTAVLFESKPFFTALLCLGKGTAAGFVAGFAYQILQKKNKTVALFTASALAPIVNTGLFILGSFVLLRDVLSENFVAQGSTIVYFRFITCAGINFLVELAINLIAAPSLERTVQLIGGKTKRK